ncbi:MAG TPA: hypothetical protein DGD08_04690 [Gemmatimonas aurantiaca]|uniref:Uncharacterized protein n=2 Tax=Gemmatimonas aurantiaca TaxID=173480 RepID=C1ADA3_GEMAT|nr:hypothetical protein [Gemmatimonas aurantiaca]BAH40480.1 hypothetical protein GAU_3438 [Gemmatimonas aurantiaca T-27]HCT56493.1 hypothetical protein [Gemmatimonas aurantiaca]
MDIEIGTIESTVRAVDGAALVDPRVKKQLFAEFMAQVRAADAHTQRVRAERDISGGRHHEDID